VTLSAKPNYRALGPRFGKSTNDAANAIRALPEDALARFRDGETVHVSVNGQEHALEEGDMELVEEAQGELVVKSEGGCTAALDVTLGEDLLVEGRARELVNRIQRLRKDSGLEITDRIALGIYGEEKVQEAARVWEEFIAGETLAVSVQVDVADGVQPQDWLEVKEVDLDGLHGAVALRRADG
jgi:isoleucyl-tRNA synthetase